MACARLGLDLVRSISVAVCIYSTFNPRSCVSFDLRYYWSTALLVADGAGWFAPCVLNSTILDEKDLHTAGLLHNIRLLWLADKSPTLSSQALGTMSEDRPEFTGIGNLTANSSDLDEVYSILAKRLDEYVGLSQTRFPAS